MSKSKQMRKKLILLRLNGIFHLLCTILIFNDRTDYNEKIISQFDGNAN